MRIARPHRNNLRANSNPAYAKARKASNPSIDKKKAGRDRLIGERDVEEPGQVVASGKIARAMLCRVDLEDPFGQDDHRTRNRALAPIAEEAEKMKKKPKRLRNGHISMS